MKGFREEKKKLKHNDKHKGVKRIIHETIDFIEKCCHKQPLRKYKQKEINHPSIIFVMVAKIFPTEDL
jgi:hypothetical protein